MERSAPAATGPVRAAVGAARKAFRWICERNEPEDTNRSGFFFGKKALNGCDLPNIRGG